MCATWHLAIYKRQFISKRDLWRWEGKTRGAFGFALTFSLLLSFVLRQKKVKMYGVFETSFDWKECRTEKFIQQRLNYIHWNPCKGNK